MKSNHCKKNPSEKRSKLLMTTKKLKDYSNQQLIQELLFRLGQEEPEISINNQQQIILVDHQPRKK
jgi:hypothetical protein